MEEELEAVYAQADEAQTAANAAQAEKEQLQRQLSLSADSIEQLQVELKTQYAFHACHEYRHCLDKGLPWICFSRNESLSSTVATHFSQGLVPFPKHVTDIVNIILLFEHHKCILSSCKS
jgi:hypothetical protein